MFGSVRHGTERGSHLRRSGGTIANCGDRDQLCTCLTKTRNGAIAGWGGGLAADPPAAGRRDRGQVVVDRIDSDIEQLTVSAPSTSATIAAS